MHATETLVCALRAWGSANGFRFGDVCCVRHGAQCNHEQGSPRVAPLATPKFWTALTSWHLNCRRALEPASPLGTARAPWASPVPPAQVKDSTTLNMTSPSIGEGHPSAPGASAPGRSMLCPHVCCPCFSREPCLWQWTLRGGGACPGSSRRP